MRILHIIWSIVADCFQRDRGSNQRKVVANQEQEVGWNVVKEREEWGRTVVSWIKKGGFYHLFIWNGKAEADREHTELSPPPPHLHWKDCRVCVKAEAYELHGAAQAPLSQFKLPHIAEHVRALSRGKANSTYCPRSFLAAMHNEDGKSRTKCRMLVRKAEAQKGVNCLITEPKRRCIQASDAGLILLTCLKQTGIVTMRKKSMN